MIIRTRLVEYEHDGVELEGYMAWDDAAAGPRPGVLVSHAWAGRSPNECAKAEQLAELGYTGFALDLYGKGVLGTTYEENSALMQPFLDDRALLQSRLKAALAALNAQPEADESRAAAIGYCFGGLCALDLARCRAGIRGAVSFHGLFSRPENLEPGPIDASVLILHGWDDPMAPPEQVLGVAKEMTEAGADWQLHAYGGTMHAFSTPGAADPDNGIQYNQNADRRSWRSATDFLEELFAD